MMKKQLGFTLMEIAIVLVVIGILLGGVLKGQELLTNAKIKRLKNDFNGIVAAYHAYEDRYRAMPGDDSLANNANRGWTDGTAGNGNGVLANNDAFAAAAGARENQDFWQHLRYSGLVAGNPAGAVLNTGGTANPTHSFNGQIGISNVGAGWGLGLAGIILCAGNLPGKAAQSLDADMDDGLLNSGQIRAIVGNNNIEPAGGTPGAAPYLDDGVAYYTVCKTL